MFMGKIKRTSFNTIVMTKRQMGPNLKQKLLNLNKKSNNLKAKINTISTNFLSMEVILQNIWECIQLTN